MVVASKPCYRLTSESTDHPIAFWRFRLAEINGEHQLEVSDRESELCPERLGLLAVIRGLEAIDRPAHVWLATSSRYVQQGIAFGLDEWRDNDWRWECFGRLVPVKNLDLWRRIDRALQYHEVASVEVLPSSGPLSVCSRDNVGQPLHAAASTASRRRLTTSIRVHRLTVNFGMRAKGFSLPVDPELLSDVSTAPGATSWRFE